MGAKQSAHIDKTFIQVNPSQRGSVDDSFMIDERLTKSHLDQPHKVQSSVFTSQLSTTSIKEDEELNMADYSEFPSTFGLSCLEDDGCQNPYQPRKISMAEGEALLKKEMEGGKMQVSLSACLDADRLSNIEQSCRTSNASSVASAYKCAHQGVVAANQSTTMGPVILMQPATFASMIAPAQASSSSSTPSADLIKKKKSNDRRLVEKVEKGKREKKTDGFTVNPDDSSTWTTRMMRNLPNDYTRQDLLDLLDAQDVRYDFIYLPIDWGKKANLGYAFVNLVCPEEAVRLDSVFSGFTGWHVGSDKVCEVVWGKPDQQSLRKNVERFRNSPVMHPEVPDEFKPMLFTLGKRSAFPAPTKRLRPPRGFKQERMAAATGEKTETGQHLSEDSA